MGLGMRFSGRVPALYAQGPGVKNPSITKKEKNEKLPFNMVFLSLTAC